MSNLPKTFIVDDDKQIGQSIEWLLSSLNISSKYYACPKRFLEEVDPLVRGCILLDVRMPEMNGLDVQQDLIKRKIQMPVIFLSAHSDISIVVQALKRGATDFIIKPYQGTELITAVKSALSKDAHQNQFYIEQDDVLKRYQNLSPRELEVLKNVIIGKRSKTIAYDLGIALKTVELHRSKIMEKMNVRTSVELTRLVITHSEVLHSLELN